jgi:hypothetical protein
MEVMVPLGLLLFHTQLVNRTLYWSGGSGTWNTTFVTDWSLTSGGFAGEPPPEATDDVIFDANSGSGTVTLSGGLCNNLYISSPSLTFGGSGNITVSGTTFTTSAVSAWTNTGQIQFNTASTVTVTTNGVVFSSSFTNTTNANTVILGDALTCDVYNIGTVGGTLNLNGYDLTCRRFEMVGIPSAIRTIAFGTNKIVITSATVAASFSNGNTNPALFSYTGTSNIEFQTTSGFTSTYTMSSTIMRLMH